MLSCRETSELVSRGLDERLDVMQRLGVRLHLAMCSACRAFARQARFLHAACRAYALRLEGGKPVRGADRG